MGFWDKNIVESGSDKDAINTALGFTPKWALTFVTNEKPIPEEWRLRFYSELTSDDAKYKELLEEAVRKHGVRWV